MKLKLFLPGMLVSLCLNSQAQRTDQPWQVQLAAGLHSFYAPVQHLKWSRSEFTGLAALSKPLGPRQQFTVGLQVGFARNNYQGDALYLQLLGEYNPVIAGRMELGIGLGAGYRVSLYPGRPYRNENGDWHRGHSFKGMLQIPFQLSIGYRSLKLDPFQIRPYLAYQLHTLLGYSPDLSPLPVSNLLLGFKIQREKN